VSALPALPPAVSPIVEGFLALFHARTHARTHARAHTHVLSFFLSLSPSLNPHLPVLANAPADDSKMFSSGQFLLGRILKSATSGFASEAKAVEVENFFKDKDTPGAERSISQVSLLCFAVHAVMVVPRAAVREPTVPTDWSLCANM
jgi:hypothetical protein